MLRSVRAFLDQVIDYAGMFPPAKLPFEDALQHYEQVCKRWPHSKLLGGFICPTARLHDLLTLAKSHQYPLHVVALGQQAPQASEFLPRVEADVRMIQEYRHAWMEAAAREPADENTDLVGLEGQQYTVKDDKDAGILAYEVALPKGLAGDLMAPIFERFGELMVSAHLQGFLEIPMTATWCDDVKNACSCIGAWRRKTGMGRSPGLKLRCGGLSADAFPSDAQVAFFIDCCCSAQLAWKATAGLHHPRRHWDEALQVWHHGFLNVFAAGVLAWTHALTEADLVELLPDRQLRDLRFEQARMIWKKWECSTAQIADARANFATSFGSCSFEEPCQDLIGLGLLDP